MALLVIADPRRSKKCKLRYGFDRAALLHWFGGLQGLHDLCAVYGVPNPCRTKLHDNFDVTANSLAILLELAERMHKPLDLYQYLREYR